MSHKCDQLNSHKLGFLAGSVCDRVIDDRAELREMIGQVGEFAIVIDDCVKWSLLISPSEALNDILNARPD
jgi:hypothetical protein